MSTPMIKPESKSPRSISNRTRTVAKTPTDQTVLLDANLLSDLQAVGRTVIDGARGTSLSGLSRAERAKLLFTTK